MPLRAGEPGYGPVPIGRWPGRESELHVWMQWDDRATEYTSDFRHHTME